jgi:hypothetical protein
MAPWRRVLCEKMMNTQMVTEFSDLYGILKTPWSLDSASEPSVESYKTFANFAFFLK